jgi:very-short-patch-repair endonuclease
MANELAKHLRRHMTGPERTLWREFRSLRKTGFIIRRQSPFGIYIVDFVSHNERLVIEVDGVSHEGSQRKAQDAERTTFIESRGYAVIRFSNDEVLCDTSGVVNCVKQMLVERRATKFIAMPLHIQAEFPSPAYAEASAGEFLHHLAPEALERRGPGPSRPTGSSVRPPRNER